jgi:hypothetical protein
VEIVSCVFVDHRVQLVGNFLLGVGWWVGKGGGGQTDCSSSFFTREQTVFLNKEDTNSSTTDIPSSKHNFLLSHLRVIFLALTQLTTLR